MEFNKKILTAAIIGTLSFNAFASESEAEFHDADPRNTSARAAVFASDEGEIKLLAGGGASGVMFLKR